MSKLRTFCIDYNGEEYPPKHGQDGSYVRFEDVAALQQQLADMTRDRDAWRDAADEDSCPNSTHALLAQGRMNVSKVNNFDVLKRMAEENKTIQLCTTITQMLYSAKKGGTEVSVGVPGNVCFEVESGRMTGFLLMYNVREFNELKAAMEQEAQPFSGDAQ